MKFVPVTGPLIGTSRWSDRPGESSERIHSFRGHTALVEDDQEPTAEAAVASWKEGLVPHAQGAPPARRSTFRRAAVASAIVAALGAASYGAVAIFSAGTATAAASAHTTNDAGSPAGTHPWKPGSRPSFWRGGMNGGPAAFGTVVSVGSKSFTLKTFSGTKVTVDVSSSTTYRDFQVASASFATLKANERVAVIGTSSSGVVNAKSVLIGGPGLGVGHSFGGWHGPPPPAGSNPGVSPASTV
jgi:hypothetical protein